jgi:hydrogenase maturation protein HypF
MSAVVGARIHINGIVQGVGFRPFVYSLARRYGLTGWVRNSSAGVDIEVDGSAPVLEAFVADLRSQAPPLARIAGISVTACPSNGHVAFEIRHSQVIPDAFIPISPDVATCEDCLRELRDPADRRYRYPFINCTNCGPRFTIITAIPYDRPNTTMAEFEMCPACREEYGNPSDRRFHAQPVACPVCGPRVWLEVEGRPAARGDDAIRAAREMLAGGRILAIKGLGGFHLACDASNATVVEELRRRKLRVDKPFAVMMATVEDAERACMLDVTERELLLSRERPIVIVQRRPGSSIAPGVAPGQSTLGVFLPYTPLHTLLLESGEGFPSALVMTSGNISDEPIAIENQEARTRLAALADAFLMHDRDIHTRCDDSVMRVVAAASGSPSESQRGSWPMPVRRARGYAPLPASLPWDGPAILAVGAELKNTFCLTRGRYVFVSQHIGDLENHETLQAFERGVKQFEQVFASQPAVLAYDLHPDYLATRYAVERAAREGLPAVGVQHHHAHIAACMAENGLTGDEPVLGASLDGVGYGDDDTLWGGEFLLADYAGYRRLCHLETIPLLGGDVAVRQPWRQALAWLAQAGIEWDDDLPPVRAASPGSLSALGVMMDQRQGKVSPGLNAPLTSSVGRLFDAVSALAGVCSEVNFEGQAAILLEAAADPGENGAYEFQEREGQLQAAPVIRSVVSDLRSGISAERISARFHNGLARAVTGVIRRLRAQTGARRVALSGGVWQNVTLLRTCLALLASEGFDVLGHRLVPPNDGGLALGQAAVASYRVVHGSLGTNPAMSAAQQAQGLSQAG